MFGNQIDYNKTEQRERILILPPSPSLPLRALILNDRLPSHGEVQETATHHPSQPKDEEFLSTPAPLEDLPPHSEPPCFSSSCLQQGVEKSQSRRVADLQKSKCKKKKKLLFIFSFNAIIYRQTAVLRTVRNRTEHLIGILSSPLAHT